ncbi:hypothetical protein NBO_501gi001 [Nosema bombycis CQ1]|uniref:C3H1-type domain-containing protein n=1 Tax=Nosema bombycis (strain CQ1 / CVCC 102059) TaxID=578461 RepID=R0MHE1_NOSB1|nr:hypothetical protein NBO_501gi001 [Nosema bombycis CQ1]|eukprot:EOB12218.1 hypothetical protein NBO_501gi001 [Nosema bombycis CQ1]
MKNLCRNYLSGSCRYGDRCRFIHPKTTSLLDPPSWIYTNVYNNPTNLNCLEISTDEVRYSLLINDTRKILDDIWFDNYSKMYKSLNEICRVGVGRSTSNRVIDLRSKPEVFNLPFDLGRVEQKIVELRKNYPVMGENDVMKGEEEEGEVKEGVPKFVKEYQEKSVSQNREFSNRDYSRDHSSSSSSREFSSNRDYSNRDSRPYSFRQPDNRYPPRDQYSRDQQYRGGSFNRDGNRGDLSRDQYPRDGRGDFHRDFNRDSNRDPSRDQYSRDANRDQYPSRELSRDQYPRDANRDKPPSYNPPFRQDSYNKPLSYPRSPQRPSQPPSYPPTQSSPYSRPSQPPTYPRPSQRPPYPPSQPKKEEEDSDFEYKNIIYIKRLFFFSGFG